MSYFVSGTLENDENSRWQGGQRAFVSVSLVEEGASDDEDASQTEVKTEVKNRQGPVKKKNEVDGNPGPKKSVPTQQAYGVLKTSGPGSDADGSLSPTPPSVLALIRTKIDRNKVYPHQAENEGVEGRVGLSFEIGEDGSVKNLRITKSSGHALLDQAALTAVRKSAPLPYIARPMGLTLDFKLEDE